MDEFCDNAGKYDSKSKDEQVVISSAAEKLNELVEMMLSSQEELVQRISRLEHVSGLTQSLKPEPSLGKPKSNMQNQLILNSLRFPEEECVVGDSLQAFTPEL